MSMELSTVLVLMLFCCCGSFIQRVSGFGFGIFAMTMLPHLLPSYGEATALSGLLAGCQSVFVAIKFRRFIDWKKLLPILCTFGIVSYFAVTSVTTIDDGTLKRILGAILIVISVYFFFFSDRVHLKPTVPVQISMGSVSGIMGGFFAMQGPPAVLYFLASNKIKEAYVANVQTYLLLGNIMMTGFRAKAGFVTAAVGEAWCYGICAVALGTWLGDLVFTKISIKVLRKVVYAYMAVSGIVALLR